MIRSTSRRARSLGWPMMILCLGLASCTSPKEKAAAQAEPPATPGAHATDQKVAAGTTPILKNAILTFYTGSISIIVDGASLEVELGGTVPVGARVVTGKDSQCDLQFGSLGTLRVQSETTVTLKEVAIGAERRAASTKLLVGSVAAKVSKLSVKDRFNVSTDSAVCGVRGTEFIVRTSAEGATKISVKEGSVALLPPSFDPEPIESKALGTIAAPAVDAVFSAMLEAAPKVGPSQEASVGKNDLSSASKAWEGLATALDVAVAPATPPASASQAASPTTTAAPLVDAKAFLASPAIQDSLARVSSASAPVAKKTKAATKDSKKELETFVSMTIYEVPSFARTQSISRPEDKAQAPAAAPQAATPASSPPLLLPSSPSVANPRTPRYSSTASASELARPRCSSPREPRYRSSSGEKATRKRSSKSPSLLPKAKSAASRSRRRPRPQLPRRGLPRPPSQPLRSSRQLRSPSRPQPPFRSPPQNRPKRDIRSRRAQPRPSYRYAAGMRARAAPRVCSPTINLCSTKYPSKATKPAQALWPRRAVRRHPPLSNSPFCRSFHASRQERKNPWARASRWKMDPYSSTRRGRSIAFRRRPSFGRRRTGKHPDRQRPGSGGQGLGLCRGRQEPHHRLPSERLHRRDHSPRRGRLRAFRKASRPHRERSLHLGLRWPSRPRIFHGKTTTDHPPIGRIGHEPQRL